MKVVYFEAAFSHLNSIIISFGSGLGCATITTVIVLPVFRVLNKKQGQSRLIMRQ